MTVVVWDSMVKGMKGWEINKKLKKDFLVIKSFPGAKSTCMDHYIMPSMEQKPENIVIHVGTNDLQSIDKASKISERIVNLALKCSVSSRVFISGIVGRGDNPVLDGKAQTVNQILEASCRTRNIPFIDNKNISLGDLNGSDLHLNKAGTSKLTANIINFISKI